MRRIWTATGTAIVFTMLFGSGALGQELAETARAFCDAHNAVPENAVYGTQVAQSCYAYASRNPGVVELMDPEKVNGKFRHGSLICDRGYYKGFDENGYKKEGPCIPFPEVEGGRFTGGSPAFLNCQTGYIWVVDRAQTPERLLLPNEMSCAKVPPERVNSLNKCPSGTINITAMSRKDRSMYPSGAKCAR